MTRFAWRSHPTLEHSPAALSVWVGVRAGVVGEGAQTFPIGSGVSEAWGIRGVCVCVCVCVCARARAHVQISPNLTPLEEISEEQSSSSSFTL